MGVLGNAGYISKASSYPCSGGDPALVIQAGVQAALPVLISAATFGCLDILRMRAGISPWHSRKLRGMINGVTSPKEKDLVNGVYKYIIPVEKMLFTWFVADLTTEFFARWQSNMFRMGACESVASESCGSGGPALCVIPAPGGEALVVYDHFTACAGPIYVTPSGFFVPGGYYYSCSYSISFRPIFPDRPVGGSSIWLESIDRPGIQLGGAEGSPGWFGNSFTVSGQRDAQNKSRGGRLYQWRASADVEAVADGGSFDCTVSNLPLAQNNIVPVGCGGGRARGGVG